MTEEIIYRAKFETWLLPPSKDGGASIAVNPRGPFEVEVFNAGTNTKPHWRACLIPTRDWFGGRGFRTPKEARDTVAANFKQQVSPWVERKPLDVRQIGLLKDPGPT